MKVKIFIYFSSFPCLFQEPFHYLAKFMGLFLSFVASPRNRFIFSTVLEAIPQYLVANDTCERRTSTTISTSVCIYIYLFIVTILFFHNR